MKISTEQKSAKQWAKALVKLNSAEPGTVQICYQDEQGNKQVGYCDLFDLEIVLGPKKMTFGAFLSAIEELGKENAKTLATALQDIETLKTDLENAKKEIADIKSCIPGLTAL